MDKETTRRQSKKEQTTAASLRSVPTTVNDLPEQVLKLVFRRLGSHVSFLRAAAVCTRWRRIAYTGGIMNHDWWNDFSTNLGHYHVADPSLSPLATKSSSSQGQPCRGVVFVPAASPSTINARHFTLDFLPSGPGGRSWEVVDGHASLLLFASHRRRGLFPDLMVCEPISRRYVRIQPIETMKYCHCLGVFLNRWRRGYRIGGLPDSLDFSLTCVLCERSTGMAHGISVVTGLVYDHGWRTRHLATSGGIHLRGAESAHYAGRSKQFIFFGVEGDDTVLAVEEGTGVLSHFRLPDHVRPGSHHHSSSVRFVDDGADNDSLVRVVSLVGDELRVFLKREHNNGGGVDWVPVRSLNLREATRGLPGYKECFFISHTAKIVTAGNGYVVLTPAEETWLFSVELRTMEAERKHIRNRLPGEVYPYVLRFRPTVRACVFRCKRGRSGPCFDICKCK